MEAETQQTEGFVDTMLLDSEHAPGGVIVYYADGDEEIIHVNSYVLRVFECDTVDEFMQLTGGTFRGFVHGEDIGPAEDSIWGQVEKQDSLDHIYYRIQTKTGRLVNIEDFGRLVEFSDGRPVFHVFIIEMKAIGYIDWLTGLPAMKRFHDLATMGAATIRRRGERPTAVALDFMGLKAFNTQYGREEGDQLLCVFADILRKHFGSEACSRFGEDHFYAFAPTKGIEDKISSLFDDLAAANDGKALPVRVGLYACQDDDDIVEVGFDRAKFACDLDRKTWHSHITWFNDEMRRRARLRIHMLEHVDKAIEEGWVQPYYQPIIRAATGRVCCEEALARWIDPEHGALQPGLFIPVLEESELLMKLDMHIIDCVLADFETRREAGIALSPVSVNISLRDLGKLDIADEIARRADAAGIPHSLLHVEFTESSASANPVLFKSQVDLLHAAGFEVWLDDFGSGYSSLNMLQNYDFDLIKLDMEFVRDVDNVKAREIMVGVVRTAGKLGVNTLAEGVETETQALFLESIGCNLLQGFFYARPMPLSAIIESNDSLDLPREPPEEAPYWKLVDSVDILEPTANVEGHAVDGTQLSEFPAGVMELRNGTWRLLRSNKAYRAFLDNGRAIPLEKSSLGAIVFENGVDEEYIDAAKRSLRSRMWERVAGRLEYGTGLQFYTRTVASDANAKAFSLVSVPTMLGTALGTYGDVPVAYAVLKAKLSDSGNELVDAEYVYANTVYCTWCNYDQSSLPGQSFVRLTGDESADWFPYFYRAAIGKEHVHDVMFSPELNHWLSFSAAPSNIENCFVYAFTYADDERRERQELIVGLDTSTLIIGVTNAFDDRRSFSESMNKALELISRAIRPERLYIFERSSTVTRGVFEWCAEGIESRIHLLQNMSNSDFETWERILKNNSTVMIPDIAQLEEIDRALYERFASHGIQRILAAPMYYGNRLTGFLVADNYRLEEGFDTHRLLETVAPYLSIRIANEELKLELQHLGTHDALTGLLNRRGVDLAIEKKFAGRDEPFVVALMDIDDFKTANDKYGHAVGDESLRAVAQAVSNAFPSSAIIGRNGGDEFVVLLFGDDVDDADEIIERLSNTSITCTVDGTCYPVSISIGYAEYPLQVDSLKSAYTKADVALYAVKLAGKAHAKRYSPEFETKYRSLLGFSSRGLAENMPGGVLVHTADDKRDILFANEELIEILECSDLQDFMEYTGGSFDGAVHPDDLPHVLQSLTHHASTQGAGSKAFGNYRILTKSGKVKNMAANSRLVETKDAGKVFYVILVDRDERRMV